MQLLFAFLIVMGASEAVPSTPLPHPPKHGGVYVVAHRGAHQGIPENTLAAYRKAIELGADFVEIDVRTTKDGQFVSMHNSTIDAYTQDAKGPVKNFTLAELKALDIGSRVGPEWREERVPTFEEILDVCQGKIGIYLDLKDAPAEKLIEILRARGMEREVIWYAGPAQQKQVQELCAECNIMPDPGTEKFLPRFLEKFKPRVIASSWKQYSERFAQTCHAAGAIVIVDDGGPESWEEALKWKTDGLQTDEPEKLIAFLEAHAQGAAKP